MFITHTSERYVQRHYDVIMIQLSAIDMEFVPDAIKAFDALNITHAPLKLIAPQFEAPLPALLPAVSSVILNSL